MYCARITALSLGAVLVFTCLAASADTVVTNAYSTPNAIIEVTANALAEKLDGRRVYFEANPTELYALINEILLPHFDTRYAGRLVLGSHWTGASSEQRDRFIQTFYDFLLRSYARGVLQFDQNRIAILPLDGELDGQRAIVKTEMRLDDGTLVPVNYSMRKSSDGWRVYDVRIEGVSYIQNYRNQLNAEIRAIGIDAVIERLRAENASDKGTGSINGEVQ